MITLRGCRFGSGLLRIFLRRRIVVERTCADRARRNRRSRRVHRSRIEDRALIRTREKREDDASQTEDDGRPLSEFREESNGTGRTENRVRAAAAEDAARAAAFWILQENDCDQEKAENDVNDRDENHHGEPGLRADMRRHFRGQSGLKSNEI